MFCPKCGSLLMPGKKGLSCSCGYSSDGAELKIKESHKEESKDESKDLGVAEEKENLPVVEQKCPKCSHVKAFYWTLQMRSADESPTDFFRCEKCKHTWRGGR